MIIGFANGVFDCFHDGHRHFLRECKMNCDELIVALNNDNYARELKGDACQSYIERATAMGEWVAKFKTFGSESELLDLMWDCKPDVIFKGEDYYGKDVTGSEIARIHWIARHPGYSSTIERMKRLHPEPIAAEDM